jgi:hypothetical protein
LERVDPADQLRGSSIDRRRRVLTRLMNEMVATVEDGLLDPP